MSLFGPTLARRNDSDARYLASVRRDTPKLRARIRDADREGRTRDALDHRRELVRMFALEALPPDASGLRLVDRLDRWLRTCGPALGPAAIDGLADHLDPTRRKSPCP
jgi:hypothetical protein